MEDEVLFIAIMAVVVPMTFGISLGYLAGIYDRNKGKNKPD